MLTNPGLNMLSHFMVGDPIQCAFTLQVVAETAFTNIVFVALPDVAARNGDFTLPTTYLSVQSDEARHISNGYATLLTVLQDDHNAPLIERDLQQAFWINHAFIDIFSAVVMEYFSRDRSDPESYLDKWDRWVRDDWHRAYVMKLGKLGLNIPTDIFDRARERLVAGVHHRHAILAFAAWPLAHWRFDPLDERDFEWFEAKYPGWYAEYGASGRRYRQGIDPAAGFLPLQFMNMAPPFCWTCQGLCVSEDDRRHRVVPGPNANGTPDPRTRFYCSQECEWMDESNPGRYTGDRNYLDRYHGWEASDVIRDIGFVRADGETLIGQPHLNDERRWTLDRHPPPQPALRQSQHPRRPRARAAVGRLERSGVSAGVRTVRFEPIGEEIECGPEETVLDAAFRQGYNLVYGCREGQCSACKCFLLEGDVALEALQQLRPLGHRARERLRAHVPGDARAGPRRRAPPLRPGQLPARARDRRRRGDGRDRRGADPRHHATRAALRPASTSPPGSTSTSTSRAPRTAPSARSRWPTSPATIEIELIIKRYPGGRLSGLLEAIDLARRHDRLHRSVRQPARPRDSERPILMIAGGSGMAPILSLLREFARQGCERPIRFFYGARTEDDLFYADEIAAELPLEFTAGDRPVRARGRRRVPDGDARSEPDVYMCGPPPMVEAAEEMLAPPRSRRAADLRRQVHDLGRGRAEPSRRRRSSASRPRRHPARRRPSATSPGTRRRSAARRCTRTSRSTPSRRFTAT